MIVEVDLYVAAIVVGVGITLFILMLLNRRDRQVTDFVKEFERMEELRADEPRRATVAPHNLG